VIETVPTGCNILRGHEALRQLNYGGHWLTCCNKSMVLWLMV